MMCFFVFFFLTDDVLLLQDKAKPQGELREDFFFSPVGKPKHPLLPKMKNQVHDLLRFLWISFTKRLFYFTHAAIH